MEINPAFKYMEAALNGRAIRQDMISSNIANVDTPFYRSKDLDFETVLAQEAHREFAGNKKLELSMAQTDENHLGPYEDSMDRPSLFYRDGHMARNDGNTVDLDVEMSELSKNSVMYNALIQSRKKSAGIFTYALEAGKNL